MEEQEKELSSSIETTIKAYKTKGGAKAIAEKIGARPGTFINKCNPAMPGHVLNVNELVAIMRITGNYTILHELAAMFGYICEPHEKLSGVTDMELLNAWADWDAERGETVQAIRNALTDQRIRRKELDRIRTEMFEDIQKAFELLQRLESLCEDEACS